MKLNKHKKNCKSLIEFKNTLRTFKEQNKPEVEDIWAIDDDELELLDQHMVNFDDDPIMCCCQEDVPHDEDSKFILKVANQAAAK